MKATLSMNPNSFLYIMIAKTEVLDLLNDDQELFEQEHDNYTYDYFLIKDGDEFQSTLYKITKDKEDYSFLSKEQYLFLKQINE